MMLTELAKEIDRLNQELAEQTDKNLQLWAKMLDMVPRKHYTNAIKSLSVCQQQIETMALELTRLEPRNRVAADAFVVLGMLESMITANPDMQTEEWKADAKAKQDVRDAAYKKSRSEAFAKKWEGTTTADNKYNGTVKKEHKP